MFPRLFDFSTNINNYFITVNGIKLLKFGKGVFTQIENIEVKRNLEFEYTLNMTIYKTDPLAKIVMPSMCILSPEKPASTNWQIFVIRNINLKDETIEISADHVKYIFLNNVLTGDPYGESDIKTGTMFNVLAEILTYPLNIFFENIFTVETLNKNITVDIGGNEFKTVGDLMSDKKSGVCKQTNSWIEFDNFIVRFKEYSNTVRNTVMYGSNISSYGQTMSNENEFTHIIPFATVNCKNTYEGNYESVTIYGTDSPLSTSSNSQFTRVKLIDFSSKFRSQKGYVIPDGQGAGTGFQDVKDRLKHYGQEYIYSHQISAPSVSVNVNIEETLSNLNADLGDMVQVVYTPTNYSQPHRITEVIYNPVLNKYISMTIGDRKYTLYDFIRG